MNWERARKIFSICKFVIDDDDDAKYVRIINSFNSFLLYLLIDADSQDIFWFERKI